MSVIRVKKNRNYTIMSNYHLRDMRLSFKAKGLLSMCLSLPDDWDYSIAGLVKISKEGKGSVTSTLRDLEKAGYLTRKQIRNEQGRIVDWEYIITEYPADSCTQNPDAENPDVGYQDMENPYPNNTTEINTKSKSTDKKSTELKITESIESDRKSRNKLKASTTQRLCDDWREIKGKVEEQIDYNSLLNDYPGRKGEIDEIVMTIQDALYSKKSALRVNGEERPAAMVKERLNMLCYDHIRYVLQSLSTATTKTKKPNQYLLTTLYNAPATINVFYSQEVNHDMYRYPN